MPYYVAAWAILLLGFTPAVVFLVIHIPSKKTRWTIAHFDASGWVFIIAILYARSIFMLIVHNERILHKAWTTDSLISMVVALSLDAIIWLRLIHFLYYRKNKLSSQCKASENKTKLDA